MTSTPFVSVIIPVYNDAERLQRCLTALEQQTYSKSCYEVIVVDNGSTEGNMAAIVATFPQAIGTTELRPGSYAARNQGLSLAKGEVIAFTDADCIPATNWIEMGVRNLLQTSNCGLVAGNIKVFFKDPVRATPVELYDSITAFPQQELLTIYHYGATANVFTYRQVIERVGLFNAQLKSGGDLEWGQRVFAFGYQQCYAEDTLVDHPARYSLTDLHQRSVRLAGGIYDIYVKGNGEKKLSTFRQLKALIRIVAEDLVSPLINMRQIISQPHLTSNWQRVQIFGVMLMARYIRAFEMIRLSLGGLSSRS